MRKVKVFYAMLLFSNFKDFREYLQTGFQLLLLQTRKSGSILQDKQLLQQNMESQSS